MVTGVVGAAAGWTLFAALAAALGAVAARWVLLPAVPEAPEELLRRAARVGRNALLMGLAGLVLTSVRQFLDFRDPFVPWTEDAHALLAHTPWGRTWHVAVAGALVGAVGLHFAARGARWGWWAATPLVLALGAYPAFNGHANAAEPRALALAADTLHVWAAGGWMGGLALVLLLARGARDGGRGGDLLPELVPPFSRMARFSVATLALTGLYAAWLHVEGWGGLTSTDYGRLLVLKLLLAAGALSLGAVNAWRWTPLLGRMEGRTGLRRTATWELAVASLVLLVTAVLVHTPPG
ncbi:MAG: hypothetical protein AMXMBFR53_31590 [Gemmatimonadota bacterium]